MWIVPCVHRHVANVPVSTVRVTIKKKQCRRAVTSYLVLACGGKGRDKWSWSLVRRPAIGRDEDPAKAGPRIPAAAYCLVHTYIQTKKVPFYSVCTSIQEVFYSWSLPRLLLVLEPPRAQRPTARYRSGQGIGFRPGCQAVREDGLGLS